MNDARLQLFVAGNTEFSKRVIASARQLCANGLPLRTELDVIDVLAQPARTDVAAVVLTPTLVWTSADATVRWVGEWGDATQVLRCLEHAHADGSASYEAPGTTDLQHRALLDSQPQPLVVLSPGGVLMFANAAAHMRVGPALARAVGTVVGLPLRQDRATRVELVCSGEQGAVPMDMQLCPTPWDGRAAWTATLSAIDRPRRPADSHQLLASIVASSDYAIISKTLDGTITSWNAGAQKIFGYSAAEAIGQSLSMLFPPERLDEERFILARIARGERVQDFESLRVHRSGRRIHVAVSISPIIGDDGAVVGASKIASDISQRYVVNEQLERNTTLLRIASRAARLGGWTLELPTRTLVWSDEICRMHEVAPGGTPSMEDAIAFYAPEYRAGVVQCVESCLRDGTAFDFKAELLTASGRRLWVRAMGEVVRDDRGQVAGLQGAFQDISEHEAATDEIRDLGTRLIDTLESITDAFFTLDRAWRFSYINGEAERLLEHARHTLLGRSVWEAFPEAVGTSFEQNYRHALAQGVTVAFEEFYPQLGRWFDVRAYPSRDGLAVYFRDTTQWRKSQEQLRASEERFQLVSKATNDAIWDWDLAQDALWWNDGLTTLFGYARDDLEPGIAAWTSRIHPDDRERVLGAIAVSIEQRAERWSNAYRFRRRDGSYAHILDRGHVVRDAAGVVVRRVGGMTDISERIALEERLRQSQRLEAVGQLTGGVAHDFNNLLTVIIGNAESLAGQADGSAGARASGELILAAATRGAELTQRLLAFSRQQALDPKVVDVAAQLKELDKLLRRALGEHIQIAYVCASHLWHALVDPAQLENALLNLCLNARDAMPQGGRLVIEASHATIAADDAGSRDELRVGDYVMLAVSDTGTGIAPGDLRRVFEPFYTTKPKGKGTGLGLAMVWGFVKQSGGHVAVYSELGQGTTIKVFLPRAPVSAPVHAANQPEGPVVGGTETILMVEDDPFVRRHAEQLLRSLGYAVLSSEDGQRALQVLREHGHVDLLFTDVVMPGIGGRELADMACGMRPGLRVLYTSGYTEDAIVHHGRLDAGVLLLGKPYRRADLARKIRAALDQDVTPVG